MTGIFRSSITAISSGLVHGVAKTTSTAAIASCLARRGKSVIVIDMDGQGDLSSVFHVEAEDKISTSAAILQLHNRWPYIYIGDHISVTPSSPEMETLLDILRDAAYMPDIVERMKHKVECITGYDYLLFDCPPALNDITRAAITVSDYILIPVIPTPMSLKALSRTIEYVKLIAGNKTIPMVLGVIDTMVEDLILHREAMGAIESTFPGLQFHTKVPKTVEMEKMILRGYDRDPLKRNQGFAAYESITDELIERIEKQ